jgi:tetratricopeptide (TPR) repeat protein
MKAGNVHKSENAWRAAGAAYLKAAELFATLSCLVQVGHAYKMACDVLLRTPTEEDLAKAVTLYDTHLIPDLVVAGRFERIASAHEALAERMEKGGDQRGALDRWGRALRAHATHGDHISSEIKCTLHTARLRAELFEYTEAIAAYERAAELCGTVDLLKYNVRRHLLDAVICALAAGDVVLAERNLERYRSICAVFAGSLEEEFAAAIVRAVGAHDVDALAEAMAQGASLLPASATLQRAKTTMTSLA